jgi:hypothetical protein
MYKSFYKEIFSKLSSIDKIKYSRILDLIKEMEQVLQLQIMLVLILQKL